MPKNLLLSLASLLVTLLVIEIILRLFFPQITAHDAMFKADDELGWTFIPEKKGMIIYPGVDDHYITTNSIGFRDDDPGTNSSAKKIMVLGDSFVSNIAVEKNEVFTEVLENNLPSVEVMNFGVNGYGTVQEFGVLQEWLPQMKPDLVIFTVFIRNDFTDNLRGSQWLYPRPTASLSTDGSKLVFNPLSEPSEAIAQPKKSWYRKLHLYEFASRRIRNMKSATSQEGFARAYTPPELYLCKKEPSPETLEMYAIMEQLLLEVDRFGKRQGVPIVFALAPSQFQVYESLWQEILAVAPEAGDSYDPSLPNDRLMEFGHQNGLMMIDLLPYLSSESVKEELLYNREEQHWTPRGNEVVAEALQNYLNENGLPD